MRRIDRMPTARNEIDRSYERSAWLRALAGCYLWEVLLSTCVSFDVSKFAVTGTILWSCNVLRPASCTDTTDHGGSQLRRLNWGWWLDRQKDVIFTSKPHGFATLVDFSISVLH
jgi:hypothetical protein